jgi:hypothetical protein
MLTTRGSLNFQYSLVFGYQSPRGENISVGDIISPGLLPKSLIKELSVDVIKYFTQYNAMIRDYTGSELFFVEFELKDISFKKKQTAIYPKSMIMVPGNYKECESLMLALKPERGYLNIHKSHKSVKKISNLFFEVEEFANRPELNEWEKEQLFNRFASRFSKKLYGALLENKWNKKLIGISDSLPTEKEYLNQYGKLKSKIEISWHKKPIEINLSEIEFGNGNPPYEGKIGLEHIKFNIATPSARFITEKTLKLGSNLLNLANIGTIDNFQEKLVKYIIKKIEEDGLSKSNNEVSENTLISHIKEFLVEFQEKMKYYFKEFEEFLISGVKGNLDYVLKGLEKAILEKQSTSEYKFSEIHQITDQFLSEILSKKENVIANDLRSAYNYFSELFNQNIQIIIENLPKYLITSHLKKKSQLLIQNLRRDFKNEKEPVQKLAKRIIDKFYEFILKNLKDFSPIYSKSSQIDEERLSNDFFSMIEENLSNFFDKINIKGEDIVSFAEFNIESYENIIKKYSSKFKNFSKEISFLLSYILRYSTINRFLKETEDGEISDPVSFSSKFHRFLEKRLAGIQLETKYYILKWIEDYGKIFEKMKEPKNWSLNDIYRDFITFLEEKESSAYDPESFLTILDRNMAMEIEDGEQIPLLNFLDKYQYYKEIKVEFPNYLKEKIIRKIGDLDHSSEELKPLNYLDKNGEENFYNFIRENELKYFSKLIPIPKTLILKHLLNNEEKKQFKGDLFQVFDFNLRGEEKLILNLQDNFKEIYREWIK